MLYDYALNEIIKALLRTNYYNSNVLILVRKYASVLLYLLLLICINWVQMRGVIRVTAALVLCER